MGIVTEMRKSHWITRFSVACVVGIVAIAGICWAAIGSLDLDPGAVAPLILGIIFTVALAVGLMALVFYSHRSGQDDDVRVEPTEPKVD
ncbi:hypothetical protein [Reyranella sp. CPCC 100927]|uniref:hypothetical protein n=1 Tax=Reyranella sp. CPCC 100927 TaxID=2599616 RepID=UPI0011B3A3A9|nr:hypothetical protein [Reyranella sp. CPCC 100927]TWT02604.1 hypothetical protein FQU96_30285 [Reyranella sp. CPCC 100927]